MRAIQTHCVPDLENHHQLKLFAVGDPGLGGASQHYEIIGTTKDGSVCFSQTMNFQKNNLRIAGIDGLTNEVLLAIVIDRLEGFQAGPFACTENAAALEHARICLGELKERTRGRVARGVEGEAVK